MTHTIFLDSDGVVCAFNDHVEAQFGAQPNHLTFDCPETGNLLKGDDALWAHIETDHNFWLDMPLFEHTHELVEMARPFNAHFLTGCPAIGYDRAAEHKVEKLGKLFNLPVITCRSKDKALHIKAPGDVLVDDMSKNIKRWEGAGGVGVRFKTWEQARAELQAIIDGWNAE